MRHFYWDSVVFLAWLLPEAKRAAAIAPIIKLAEAGEVRVITSSVSLIEVIHLKGQPNLNEADSKKIDGFFRNNWIVVRNTDRRLATLARELIWTFGVAPKDAIHVATALDAKLEVFHTYDSGLIALSDKLGDPKLKISEPIITEQTEMGI